jgi:DNA adenine methylase
MNQNTPMQTFLRWNGGKQDRLILYDFLLAGFPTQEYTYIEPFLGGGSLYFHLTHRFRNRFIGDIDPELINLYQTVRDNCPALMTELQHERYWYTGNADPVSKAHYYEIRDEFRPTDRVRAPASR